MFKNWPTSNASLVDVTKVEELRVLKQTEVSQQPITCSLLLSLTANSVPFPLNALCLLKSLRRQIP